MNGTNPRVVVEVTDLIEDVLGANFSFSEMCPYFYINGKEGHSDRLGKGRRRLSGEMKIQKLADVGSSVLLMTGYSDAADLREQLADLADRAPGLRQFIVVGCSPTQEIALKLLACGPAGQGAMVSFGPCRLAA